MKDYLQDLHNILVKENIPTNILYSIAQMKDKEKYHSKILKSLRMNSGPNEVRYLNEAVKYLGQGITTQNLLRSGLLLISLMPYMQDVQKLVRLGKKIDPDAEMYIANKIFNSSGRIKSTFDMMKQKQYADPISYYIEGGDLLSKYSDRIWQAVRQWMLRRVQESKQS